MAFNGTGTFVRIYNWATDKINSVPITASRMDTEIDGIATGLSNCLTKDGQTTVTANIPMASHKFTGLSVGNARTDSLTLGQVQDGQFTALGLTGGAADAYTATPSPAIAAYVATMQYSAKIHATNLTTTPTLLISAISGGTIKKLDASKAEVEVEASDMLVNGFYNFKRNVANDAWILLNPEKAYYNLTNSTAATESVAGIAILPKQITIANGTDADHDLNFGAFNAQADDGSLVFSVSALTKQIDATWAAGNDQGGLDTGTVANSIPYYIFAIYNPSTLVSDILFSASKTSPTLPSGFTKKEYKGACHTDGSANIRQGTYLFNNNFYKQAKDKKKAEIKALRDNNLLLPTPLTIELSGLNKQFNIKSVDLLMFGTIIAVLSQSEGSTRSWQAGDGVRYELTVNDYRSLVNHLISRDELEFFQAKLKIAALSLLNTVEEIEAFDINEIIIS
jgi:hypothetical protein